MKSVDAQPGTCALLLAATRGQTLKVGRLGTMRVRPGWYVYVGSALGPGGLAARLSRHARPDKTLHWHIDYLRAVARLEEVWFRYGACRGECLWAEAAGQMPGVSIPMDRFGASDCSCSGHLFRFDERPSRSHFACGLSKLEGHGAHVQHAVVEEDRPDYECCRVR